MNSLTFDQLVEMIAKAKEAGLTELKAKGVYIKFATPQDKEIIKNPNPISFSEETFKPISPLEDMTAEEVLYYATPYYDVIQAEKEIKKQQLKEKEYV